ncbi:MAG: bifunctional NADP-dependent methylenetetrahydromethanopterin dehydrogenase/methylenetetrahydrofolate dehydrogenase [Planctomycetaceae bacterium]|nr:bifunctional NADP-dependent methylenetetrahydromethanopterin dehydrogenase/methylenetetrahydrofolate dehydrogenase [Planctomycetaceae bacterium]
MKNILIQFDTDPLPSTFDRVVAVDAGADEVFAYGGVTPENVTSLVHGAIFTRGPDELKHTAIFVGGSDVASGEAVLEKVTKTFFGPMRVSVMMDSNGSNTTAAAAVQAAARHMSLKGVTALVLGGTGPVGHRAAQILAMKGAHVRIGSRSVDRAAETCDAIRTVVEEAIVEPVGSTGEALASAITEVELLIAAGASGVQFLSESQWQGLWGLKVAIDLNAVPPVGLEGIGVTDKAKEIGGITCYGAIGVGGTKMKVHKAAIKGLFESNHLVLDTAAIAEIASEIG